MTNKSTTLAEGITTQVTTTTGTTTTEEHPNTKINTIAQNEATIATMQGRNNSAVQTEATTKVQSNSTTIILAGSNTTAPESNISNKISQTTIIVVVPVRIIVLCLIAGASIAVIIIVVRIKRQSKKKSGSSNKNSHNHSHLNYSNEKSWAAGPNHFDTAIPLNEGIQLTPSTIQDEALHFGYDSVDTTTHNHVTPSTAIKQQDNNCSQIKSERMYMYSAAQRPGKAKDEPLPPIPPYKVEDMYATHLEEPPPVPPQTTEMLYAAVRKKRKKSKDDHNYY